MLAVKVKNKDIYEIETNPEEQESLIEDLEQIKEKDFEGQGKRGIVPKEKVLQAIGRSPDDGDTYIMRMSFEIVRAPGLKVIGVA